MRPLVSIMVLCCAASAQAQLFQRLFNPTVKVTLTHPPGLGLKVQRVAFAPTSDEASEELVGVCVADLSRKGRLEVVDRGNLQRLLQEQKFSNSGLVDEATAVELGKVLGAPLLLFVKVHTFKVSHVPLSSRYKWKDAEGAQQELTTYIAKTQVDLSATIQAVDCATGKIYSAQRLTANPSQENRSDQGLPEYPSDLEVRETALRRVRRQVRHMLLPWKESRKLIFYDDKDYGMKDAYRRLQAQDYPGATAKSQEALDQAKADPRVRPKYLCRTNYNLGMCKFIQGDPPAALPLLKAAVDLDPATSIFQESLAECRRAVQLQEEMARVATRTLGTKVEGQSSAAPAPVAVAVAGSLEERLERLERLKDKGLLTPEEYRQRRADLLKEL